MLDYMCHSADVPLGKSEICGRSGWKITCLLWEKSTVKRFPNIFTTQCREAAICQHAEDELLAFLKIISNVRNWNAVLHLETIMFPLPERVQGFQSFVRQERRKEENVGKEQTIEMANFSCFVLSLFITERSLCEWQQQWRQF